MTTTRTVRFHEYGEPADVLRVDEIEAPEPLPGHIRVAVRAAGIAPADWALCRGLFPGSLPRGIGTDGAGTVDAIGEGVTGVELGDRVFGTADFADYPSAGAADLANMDRWFAMPPQLSMELAAALPMAFRTADLHLTYLGAHEGQTLLVNGAGGTVGFAAVQIAILRGAKVVAVAGPTYADQLRAFGARVVSYGAGLSERVRPEGRIDLVLDCAPVGGALPELVALADDDPTRVMTISDFEAAAELGVRDTFHEPQTDVHGYESLGEFARLAADGRLTMPIAATFGLDGWRDTLDLSLTGHPRGKLLFVP